MPASLMTLPYELREQILFPVVQGTGTIGLQYPLWADKSVFVPPIAQVCKALREEVFQSFYRANVFVWVIDPEAVRDWGARVDQADPSTFPLEQSEDSSKECGPSGPLISNLPWRYPYMLANLRHLRLNLYLPPQHDISLWTDKFGEQLSSFVEAVEHGQKLKDFKILIGTWHTIRELGKPQSDALGILERMQVRGTVQVRTRSLDPDGKAVVRGLGLGRRMKSTDNRLNLTAGELGVRHLDWEWEGGAAV